jgi:hypothetical protein
MPRKKTTALVDAEQIEARIHAVRGVRVILDSDIAELYGIPTSALNQAVDRNIDRFPHGFSFRLAAHEFAALISQAVITKVGRGGRTKLPRVFTEEGVAMLSSVLRSPTAVRVNIEIMRAFVRIGRLLATPGELVAQLQKLAETVRLHDSQIKAVADILRKLMEPPPNPAPTRRIGFAVTDNEPSPEEKT